MIGGELEQQSSINHNCPSIAEVILVACISIDLFQNVIKCLKWPDGTVLERKTLNINLILPYGF